MKRLCPHYWALRAVVRKTSMASMGCLLLVEPNCNGTSGDVFRGTVVHSSLSSCSGIATLAERPPSGQVLQGSARLRDGPKAPNLPPLNDTGVTLTARDLVLERQCGPDAGKEPAYKVMTLSASLQAISAHTTMTGIRMRNSDPQTYNLLQVKATKLAKLSLWSSNIQDGMMPARRRPSSKVMSLNSMAKRHSPCNHWCEEQAKTRTIHALSQPDAQMEASR